MRDLLFDVPWYLPTFLAVIGLSLFVSGNRRQKPRLRGAGIALVLVAVTWAVVSYLVDTPKEISQKQTRRLVQSVVDRNWNTFDALLDPGVSFRFVGSPWQIDGRDTLSDAVKADVNQIGLKSAHISDIETAKKGDTITVTMKVWTTQDLTLDRPLDSQWELDWRQAGASGRWLLRQIRAIEVTGVTPDQVRGTLRKR